MSSSVSPSCSPGAHSQTSSPGEHHHHHVSSSSIALAADAGASSRASFDTLLAYLLASKRSLSTIDDVYRANTACAAVRNDMEQAAIITARTAFLRSGVTSHLRALTAVKQQAALAADGAAEEYTGVVTRLDEADARLRGTLQGLRDTLVESKLRPAVSHDGDGGSSSSSSNDDNTKRRCLIDFIDESGVQAMKAGIKSDMQQIHRKFELFEQESRALDKDLEQVEAHMRQSRLGGSSWLKKSARSMTTTTTTTTMDSLGEDDAGERAEQVFASPLPLIAVQMQEVAREMAVSLEGLVKHFDLCVAALKHVDGGGDAALKVAEEVPATLGVQPASRSSSSSKLPGTDEVMTDEEWADMLQILEDDALQVEDVVMEMRRQADDIEALYRKEQACMAVLVAEGADVAKACDLLTQAANNLPCHIAQIESFQSTWQADRAQLHNQLEEMTNADGIYRGFLRAYDSLIIEIGRRKTVEAKMRRIAQEAMDKVAQLYDADAADREAFRQEQGEFLPVDLWPGISDAPAMPDFIASLDELGRVPDLSASVIHAAIRRVQARD